jgi:hypothetical protein
MRSSRAAGGCEPNSRAAEFPGLIKQYQDLNPGVTIELNAGFQNFNPTVQTAIVGGDPRASGSSSRGSSCRSARRG